jgi:hypothetical protein
MNGTTAVGSNVKQPGQKTKRMELRKENLKDKKPTS